MSSGEEAKPEDTVEPGVSTVTHRILERFFKELRAVDGYHEIADRLHKTVIEEGSYAEANLRKAIFGDEGA